MFGRGGVAVAVEKGEPWVVVDLMPGVRAVRFTHPALHESRDEPVFHRLWDRLLEDGDRGHIVILNFQRVHDYNSYFLAGLIHAAKKLGQRGGMFIGCHLSDELLRTWRVAGLRQPLDFILNYVSSEGEAIEKARLLRGET